MLVVALVAKGMVVTCVMRCRGRASVQLGFHISLDNGKDLFSSVSRFQIVPDANGEL
jgi:hypothetical protein